MRILLTTGAALTLLTMFALPGGAATICNCGPPITPVEAIRDASYIVEGVAVDKWMTLGPDIYSYDGRLPIEAYLFRVARGWKGYNNHELRLEQGYTFCEHHFAIGHRYLMLITSYDSPAHLFASACFRLYEGAEMGAFAAELGPPTVSFDLPDTVTVPLSSGLRRRFLAPLVASVAVYSWVKASRWTGRAVEKWPYSSSRNRAAALCTAWGVLITSLLTFAASIVAIARRRWLRGARFLAIASFVFVLSFLLPGLVLLTTNEWLAAAAFSWDRAPTVTLQASQGRR